MSRLCLEKHGALKHQIETPVWVLNDFSYSNFLEPCEPRRNWLSNMHLTNLFLYDRNNLYGYDAQISFKRILYKKLNGGDPLQLVPCLTAGSMQATIFLGYSQLRTEHGMLVGTLPFTSGTELLQENLRKFWPVSGEPQSALQCGVPPLTQFSYFGCQVCIGEES